MPALSKTRRTALLASLLSVLASLLLFPSPAAAFAPASPTPRPAPLAVAEAPVDKAYRDTALLGMRPVITGGSEAARAALNQRLDAMYSAFLKRHAAADVKRLSFETKTFASDGAVSVVFTCAVEAAARSEKYARALVFDEAGTRLAISDVLGKDCLRLVNRSLTNEVSASPRLYNPSFKGLTDESDFYLEDGAVVVPFGSFEFLASPALTERWFPIVNFKRVYVPRQDYFVKAEYNVRMIPLRPVAEAFGLRLTWEGETGRVSVLQNKTVLVSFIAGQNKYEAAAGLRRALESAAEIQDDRTFAPFSFFEEFLPLCATIEPNGDVTFAAYLESYED